jgi:hypothetical protein
MDSTGSLEGLQNFLDTGGDVNYRLPALFGTDSRTLLQTAASTGTSDMVALLLQRGASLKYLTDDNKSVVDLACDAENWDSFELLKNAADDQYPHILPKPRKLDHRRNFFPSEFFFKLRNPFGGYYKNLRLVSPKAAEDMIEDMVQRTKKLKVAGELGEMVPYPEENIHLICESLVISASILVPRILTIFESTLPGSHRYCIHAPREGREHRARVGFCWILVKSMLKIPLLR